MERKKLILFVLCLLVFQFASAPAYANILFRFVLGIDAETEELHMRMHRQQQQENRRVISEDPERVRVLLNYFTAYERVRYLGNSRETIELRVTPTRVRPGETVRFEAIPSSDTPDLGSRLRLRLGGRDFHLASLSREWFGNTYRGSLRFTPAHSGVFTFRIVTQLGHHSNSVSVVVAPDCSQLSWIRVHMGVLHPPTTIIDIIEGSTTSPPVELLAEGRRRWTFFGPREERFFLSSPALGIQWVIEDESIAVIAEERSNGIVLKGLTRGETALRARYGSLETRVRVNVIPHPGYPIHMPLPPLPSPSPPRPVSPPYGFVGRVGERIQLEVTPFDSSKGHIFVASGWRVFKVNPETGQRVGTEVAELRRGNSERAEWTPIGPGTFEWEVGYGYLGDYYGRAPFRGRQAGRVISSPKRITIVDEYYNHPR